MTRDVISKELYINEGLPHKISVSLQTTTVAMMYLAALLAFGCVVEFTKVGAQDVQCASYCNTTGGCYWVSGTPCATCECSSTEDKGIECTPPKCPADCPVDSNARPCPACNCGSPKALSRRRRHAHHCSMPECPSSCKLIHHHHKSCPTCDCQSSPPQVQCSPPKCDGPGCYLDDSTKPCPSCVCSQPPAVQCDPVKCDNGCDIDYSTQPCPSCKCNNPPTVECSPPVCNQGCTVDSSTKPCPSCRCNNDSPPQTSGAVATAQANTNRGYYGR